MARNGKRLTPDAPKYGRKRLVTADEERDLKRRRITFSFSFFRQIKHFGIGDCTREWYAGLLQRLSTLCDMTLQELLEENKGSKALRCHPIDWSAKHVPLRREDLDWLPQEIRENDVEFPIMQISISQSTGRIIGYFDRDASIFHIVLLDPKHNLQPAAKTNYQVQPTQEALSQYDELLKKLEYFKELVKSCPNIDDKLHEHLKAMERLHDNIVYVDLDDDFYEIYRDLLKRYSLREIIEAGVTGLLN